MMNVSNATGDSPARDMLCLSGGDCAHYYPHGHHRLEVHLGMVRPSFPSRVLRCRHDPALPDPCGCCAHPPAARGGYSHAGLLVHHHLRPDDADGPRWSDCVASDGDRKDRTSRRYTHIDLER